MRRATQERRAKKQVKNLNGTRGSCCKPPFSRSIARFLFFFDSQSIQSQLVPPQARIVAKKLFVASYSTPPSRLGLDLSSGATLAALSASSRGYTRASTEYWQCIDRLPMCPYLPNSIVLYSLRHNYSMSCHPRPLSAGRAKNGQWTKGQIDGWWKHGFYGTWLFIPKCQGAAEASSTEWVEFDLVSRPGKKGNQGIKLSAQVP